MDVDSHVPDFIEIVPLDNDRNCSESSTVKASPCIVKVCMHFWPRLYLCIVMSYDYKSILLVFSIVST